MWKSCKVKDCMKLNKENKSSQESLISMISENFSLEFWCQYCAVTVEIKYKMRTSFETLTSKKQQHGIKKPSGYQ